MVPGLVWCGKGTLPLQLSTVTVCDGDPETSKTAQFSTFSVADILGDFHELNGKVRLSGSVLSYLGEISPGGLSCSLGCGPVTCLVLGVFAKTAVLVKEVFFAFLLPPA